jgi:hypothetical protein
VTLRRSVPQALAPIKYAPPASQQAPVYQDTAAPIDANGSYMGDATVLPTRINYASQDGDPEQGVGSSQRHMLEDRLRPTTWGSHGYPGYYNTKQKTL